MKFCKDCKHYQGFTLANAEVCVSPNLPTDLVSGKPKFALCKDLREPNELTFRHFGIGGVCGNGGDWFEPRITEAADLDDLSTIPFGK